jgi:hypothetical protein
MGPTPIPFTTIVVFSNAKIFIQLPLFMETNLVSDSAQLFVVQQVYRRINKYSADLRTTGFLDPIFFRIK